MSRIKLIAVIAACLMVGGQARTADFRENFAKSYPVESVETQCNKQVGKRYEIYLGNFGNSDWNATIQKCMSSAGDILPKSERFNLNVPDEELVESLFDKPFSVMTVRAQCKQLVELRKRMYGDLVYDRQTEMQKFESDAK